MYFSGPGIECNRCNLSYKFEKYTQGDSNTDQTQGHGTYVSGASGGNEVMSLTMKQVIDESL